MTDDELLRYSRQIMLSDFGIEGQQTLRSATALLIGIGGLGAVSSSYLASAGIGRLILCDFDHVELSNLQRQIIHHTPDIGKLKVESAREKLHVMNPLVTIETHAEVNEAILASLVEQSDIVLDGTDNFESRFLLNRLCYQAKVPLVSAAVIKYEGQVATFASYQSEHACYECVYKPGTVDNSCTANGIMAPMAGVIGSLQALEAIKVLTQPKHTLTNKLFILDGLTYNSRVLSITKDPECAVCHS